MLGEVGKLNIIFKTIFSAGWQFCDPNTRTSDTCRTLCAIK